MKTSLANTSSVKEPAAPVVNSLVVEFPTGIPGFESHHRFVLIASEDLSPLGCLKSIDSPDVTFLVIDPRLISLRYDLTLTNLEQQRLGVDAGDPLLWLSIVTITESEVTAN